MKSLKTKKKGLAQHCLEQHVKGKYGLRPIPTMQEYFDKWIEKKIEPLFRRALIRDYKQHFRTRNSNICVYRLSGRVN